MKRKNPIALLIGWVALTFAPVHAPAAEGAGSVGTITGKVLNAASGNSLNKARLTVKGTNIQALTNDQGEYRLIAIPAGPVELTVSFTGFEPQTKTVMVAAGQTARMDVELALAGKNTSDPSVVVLEKFTVQASELTAQAVALQERRTAPNIKNVIAIENDMGEGNIGEFLRVVPGIALDMSPETPAFAYIRGMPPEGTLITTDGIEVSSAGVSQGRAADLGLAATGNIDRVEVSKVPTPDMPANAVGGSINLISKSAFSRKKPLLTYSLYATASNRDGYHNAGVDSILNKTKGPDDKSNMRRINPGTSLSYLYPVNDSLAVALSFSYSNRYTDFDFRQPVWDKVAGIKTGDRINPLPKGEKKLLFASKVDWKLGDQMLTLGISFTSQDIFTRQFPVVTTFGAGATGDSTFTQGTAAGVGSMAMSNSATNQDKRLALFSLGHRYTKGPWTTDANVSFSKSQFKVSDVEGGGFFGGLSATLSNLVLREDAINPDSTLVGKVTATTRTGAPVDIYDGNLYTVASASSAAREIRDRVIRSSFNVARDFNGAFPLRVKVGTAINQQKNDIVMGTKSWTFTPPGGTAARLASNYDLLADNFNSFNHFDDINGEPVPIRFLSLTKLKTLYDQNPSWFVLNLPNAYINRANATKAITETIEAAYLRTDLRLIDNRLTIVSGMRFEGTEDKGAGVLNDIRRTYQQDASGKLILDSAGHPIKVTTDALQAAQLQYVVEGTHSKTNYGGFFPSVNASFSILPQLVARAAYARTIGRPNFPEIVPGLTITDPGSDPDNRTITVVNSALKPWTADNFDLTLEAYEMNGATASVSLFQKSITDFFTTTRTAATAENLKAIDLTDEYLDYDIVTKRNGGKADLSGVEFEYRQALLFLPHWARGAQVFGNATFMKLSGPNAADFGRFTNKTGNWGISFSRPRFNVRVSINYTGLRRVGAVEASATVRPGTYTYYAPQTRLDVTASYMINRRLTLYADVRNLTGAPIRSGSWSPDTPAYARINSYQYGGALFSLGLRGQF